MIKPSRGKTQRGNRATTRSAVHKADKNNQPNKAASAAGSRLESLVLSSPAVIYTCRPTGDYAATYITPNVKDQLGYRPKDFMDNPEFWLNHIHPEDRQRVCRELKTLPKKDFYLHEYRFQHKNGSYRWMCDRLRLVRDSQGKSVEIVGCWTDVTDRKRVEEALRESETKYRTLFESSPDGILLADSETRTFQYA